MAHIRLTYELSLEADKDIEDIFDYTAGQFGIDQAIKYVSGFEDTFQHLCIEPKLGRERNELRKGLRSISNERHTVFYRILKDRIRIIRVLHGSRDITKFLPPEE